MAKRKQRRQKPTALAPRRRLEELDAIDQLMQRKRWTEARALLQPLARQQPEREDLLGRLVNVCSELHDAQGCLEACEGLSRLHPNDPDITGGLAGAYLTAEHPSLALRTFRRFLSRWPDDDQADDVRTTIDVLETVAADIYQQLGLDGEQAEEIATLHDEVQVRLEQGRYPEARRVAEQLLRHRPDFVPALNNLSQVEALDGHLDRASDYARRVLAIEPDNLHALANLVSYLCRSGQPDEARGWAEQLKAVEPARDDTWLKQAEALSFLGNDQGVLDAFAAAQQSGVKLSPNSDGLLHHLTAVATLRLGRATEARRLWQRALKLAPGLELAKANLADLKLPPGERHGPWAYSLNYWVSSRTLSELAAQTLSVARRGDEQALARANRRYLERHPALASLVPLLLERGDPPGRELALHLAVMTGTPELLAALRDFALGQYGPDQDRLKAAETASQADLMPPGNTRFWLKGAWTEVQLRGYEIDDEPSEHHDPAVERWHREAMAALRRGDGLAGEQLLRQALELEPDSPSLLNNLANAYQLQGREREAKALIHEIHAQHPDYLFAITALAQLAARDGRFDEAQALLEPLLARRRFHYSEFAALSDAQINLHLASGNIEAARSCLEMWAQVDPDHPGLAQARQRLSQRSAWKRLGLRR